VAGEDDRLIARLGQLALVELDALVAGSRGEHRSALIGAHDDELHRALAEARARMAELRGELGLGPDPMAVIDAPLGGGAGQGAAERAAARLATRAAAARALARLDEAAARLLPHLAEAARKR
jgi:hypothetical protein